MLVVASKSIPEEKGTSIAQQSMGICTEFSIRFYRPSMSCHSAGTIVMNETKQILSLRDSRCKIYRELVRIHDGVGPRDKKKQRELKITKYNRK